MRLIDAYSAKEAIEYTLAGDAASMAERVIDRQPTVDAIPVVRCENCHHGEPCGDEIVCLHPELVMETDGCTPIRKKDFFCAFGETKEGTDYGIHK